MGFTELVPWGVGQRLTAVALNKMVTAIAELQAVAASYQEKRWDLYEVTGAWSDYAGPWPTRGGYVSSGTGVAVPHPGAYAVMLHVTTASSWSGLATHDILANYVTIARTTTSSAEQTVSVSAIVGGLAAGGVIGCAYKQDTGATLTVDVTLTIIYLGPTSP